MVRLKLVLAYDGAGFCGWQYQKGARTVQDELERAASRITGRAVRVHGAGRTDSGVHALGQVAHLDVPASLAHIPWARALNGLLPRDLSVVSAGPVGPDFHARFDARSKTYSYTLWTEPEYVYPQRRGYVWACGPLDLAAMDAAAAHFPGRRDFKAFQNAGTEVRSTVRTVMDLSRSPGWFGPEVVWRITADGFLKQMARNIVGCLVACGKGKVPPDSVRSLLDEKDRTLAPGTAPARGLCLERVDYGETALDRDQVGP
ncbi:MAG: tRNA pseudouridine(38-40) synthase TruA [Desulfovibrionaceae bacterium]|nr:tRNA pseudouridine(38-40) synthase TruA [Desulfovibrionaceae bacterium]